ncbi:TSUP family transporter [Kribbella sp. NPDC050470]|uniref:TSUP family transporter n=1 Tax=unclassified Kribbella TaxID=2644121 RepID=UPI0037B9D3A6
MPAELMLGGIVLLGASVQRLTGMGFALVAVPALVLLLGPGDGVALANCAAGLICLAGLTSGWHRVRLRAMVPLILASGCTVPLGTWFSNHLPEPALLITMGALVTAAVLVIMRGVRVPSLSGLKGALAAGAAGGFMNASAGLGGPPVSLYAVNAGWTIREFVPNALFYGVVVNLFSVVTNGVPRLDGGTWIAAAAGLTGGAIIGKALSGRVPEDRARLLVLLLALLGGITTLVKGALGV